MFVALFAAPVAPLPSPGPDDLSSCVKTVRREDLVQRRGIWDLFCTMCIRLGILGSFLYFFYLMVEVARDLAKIAVKFPRC
jgi:hypothetical protein